MKRGGGKGKGSAFEREICKKLSLWVTNGEREDVFWRSSMSGGRATVSKGKVRQAGDICAVAPEGHPLLDRFYFECKHYKDLTLDSLVTGKGNLVNFWKVAVKEASKYERVPVLIFKRNHWPILVCSSWELGARFHVQKTFLWMDSEEFGLLEFLKFEDLIKSEYDHGH